MSGQGWQETLVCLQVDGTALNTSTTPTSLIGTGTIAASAAKYTLPAGFFSYIGKALRVRAYGRMSNINPTPGNFTFDVRFGSTVVFNGGAQALNAAAAKTNVSWAVEILLTCRAIGGGTTANLMGTGTFTSESASVSATGVGGWLLPATAPAVGTGFDSTASQQVDIFGTFSVSNASNSIQLHQYILEAIN